MAQKNPIKFLSAYTKDDLDIFFGRNKETDRLYETVNRSKIVLLYGLSGTGKTSLINCGLENKYEAEERIFIYVRRGTDINQAVNQAIRASASSLIHPNSQSIEALEILYFDFLCPITIVFDQFEELFISGDYDEIQDFTDLIAEIFSSNLKVKIIFSLREEYLAHMDNFAQKIPSIYDHRYRLEKMRRQTLEEVIVNIADSANISIKEETVPGQIIENISNRKGDVELPYLQVYLDKLTRLADTGKVGKQFTEKLVEQAGELEDVLGDFLDEQVSVIANKNVSKEYVNSILKQMITPEGTKRQLNINEFDIPQSTTNEQLLKVLADLERSRIVKLEDGIYELSHDSLAQKVAEKRTAAEMQLIEVIKFIKNAYSSYRQTGTLLDIKQLRFVQPYLSRLTISDNELKFIRKSKNRRRKIRIFYAAAAVVLIVAIAIAGYFIQNDKYDKYIKAANRLFGENKYGDAKLNFQRALDVIHFIDKTDARQGMKDCEEMISQRPRYLENVGLANNFFNLGVSFYDSAFIYYVKAQNTGYRPDEINELILDKQGDAISKYYELAKLEDESSHLDISLVLLSKAYILGDNNRVADSIDGLLNRIDSTDLNSAINEINETHPFDPDRAEELMIKYREKLTMLQ